MYFVPIKFSNFYIIDITTFVIVNILIIRVRSKFEPKISYLGVLGSNFEESLWYWNQHSRICLIFKFREKKKMPRFVTKKCVFLSIFGLECENNIVRLKWAPSNLSIAKVCNKIKIPKLGTKISYLGIFGLEVWKTIVIFKFKKRRFNSYNDI